MRTATGSKSNPPQAGIRAREVADGTHANSTIVVSALAYYVIPQLPLSRTHRKEWSQLTAGTIGVQLGNTRQELEAMKFYSWMSCSSIWLDPERAWHFQCPWLLLLHNQSYCCWDSALRNNQLRGSKINPLFISGEGLKSFAFKQLFVGSEFDLCVFLCSSIGRVKGTYIGGGRERRGISRGRQGRNSKF